MALAGGEDGRTARGIVLTASGSLYPLDDSGAPIANYVQVPVGALPCFAAEPPGAGLPTVADVMVVGAGYTGVSAALHLGLLRRAAGSDAPRLLLLEAGRVGCGPSGKSGGHVCRLQVPDELGEPWPSSGGLLSDTGYPVTYATAMSR